MRFTWSNHPEIGIYIQSHIKYTYKDYKAPQSE